MATDDIRREKKINFVRLLNKPKRKGLTDSWTEHVFIQMGVSGRETLGRLRAKRAKESVSRFLGDARIVRKKSLIKTRGKSGKGEK